jgi:FKBP-type peptidyl-prolyl cis-trans isomerase
MQRLIFRPLSLLGVLVATTCAVTFHAASVEAKPAQKAKAKTAAPKTRTLPGGLKVTDLRVGKGATARAGQNVTVHYRGRLTNGKQFDASYDRGEPFTFSLGAGQVIQGWDRGVAGMKVGGKRKLVIPASLGYGAQGAGGVIPPNATLVFDVELLKVQ